MLRRKPKLVEVIRTYVDKGQLCWEIAEKDFDRMFAKFNVFEIDGRIQCSMRYGGQDIIVYRGVLKENELLRNSY